MLIEEKTYQLFVGANNFTGEIDSDTLFKVLDDRHDGYTVSDGEGVWKGKHEPMKVITISDVTGQVIGTARKLRDLLNQDAIGVVELPKMEMVS